MINVCNKPSFHCTPLLAKCRL